MRKRLMALLVVVVLILCSVACAESEYEVSYNSNSTIHPYYMDEMNRYILRSNDLSKENLCYTIREIIEQECLGDEVLDCVYFREKGHLGISVFIGFDPLRDLTDEELSQIIMERMTNALLFYPELDKYWNKITFLTEAGSILLTKDMIRTDERGRYFNAVFRYDSEYYYDYIADVIR